MSNLDRERSEGLYLKFSEPLMEPHTPVIIERVNGDCTVSQFIIARDEAHGLINQLRELLCVPAATQEQPAGSEAAIRETAVTWLKEHKKAWSAYDLFSLIRLMQPGSPRKVGEDGALKVGDQVWVRATVTTWEPESEWVRVVFPSRGDYAWQKREDMLRSSSVPVGEQKQEEGV